MGLTMAPTPYFPLYTSTQADLHPLERWSSLLPGIWPLPPLQLLVAYCLSYPVKKTDFKQEISSIPTTPSLSPSSPSLLN